ncbi:MAG: metallophosphoesterase family protein, partial [Chloroflexota bacterium]|nr:metallophosphoesterase family protein [Chloroflexota bacterium]
NHEGYVIWHAQSGAPRSGPLFDVFRYSYWTYEQLGADVSVLKAMPKQVSKNHSEAGEFRVVHASMKGERRGIYPGTDEDALLELIAPPPAVLAVGHTHRPLIRRVEDALVVNAGSVGLPFDGDQRAAYAQIVYKGGSWSAEIIRLSYDVAQAERDFYATGFLRDAGPLSRLILLELQLSLSQFHCWVNRYMDSVLEGEISVDEAVEEYLGNPITQLCW